MKRILYILLFFFVTNIYADSFSEIFKDDSIENKTVSLVLRLKNIDYDLKYITFYDSDNIDIVFDLQKYFQYKKYRHDYKFTGLHLGIEYDVKFIIRSVDNDQKQIQADLIDFEPSFLRKIVK